MSANYPLFTFTYILTLYIYLPTYTLILTYITETANAMLRRAIKMTSGDNNISGPRALRDLTTNLGGFGICY